MKSYIIYSFFIGFIFAVSSEEVQSVKVLQRIRNWVVFLYVIHNVLVVRHICKLRESMACVWNDFSINNVLKLCCEPVYVFGIGEWVFSAINQHSWSCNFIQRKVFWRSTESVAWFVLHFHEFTMLDELTKMNQTLN